MEIQRAIDWNQVSIDLQSQMNSIPYNPDLRRMYKNIDSMVSQLSKLEVSLRRSGKYNFLDDKVKEINDSIKHLEKLILIAKLMS